MAIEKWVEEFLWRGRHSGDIAPAGYHVVIGAIGPETINKPVMSDPLTPAQADAEGFTLGTIIAGINQEALTSRDAAIAAQKAAETDRDEKIAAARVESDGQIMAITADRDKAIAERDAVQADSDQKIAAITAERDAAIAALPVVPVGSISKAEFQARFTDGELGAIWAVAAKDATGQIGAGLTRGLIAQQVDLAAPGLKLWIDALVEAGALAQDRATEILTPAAPATAPAP